MINATLCYVKQNWKTLMMHRVKKENDIHEGKYNGLWWKFEFWESPEECCIREIKEESWLDIVKPTLKGILTFPNFAKNQDRLVFVFTSDNFKWDLCDCEEWNLEWIDDEKLLDLPLWEWDKIFLPWLLEERFFSWKFIYKSWKLIQHSVIFYK